MFNNPSIKKTDLVGPNQILFDVGNRKSVSVIISKDIAAAFVQTVDGRKIVKAGTPIAGDLKARKTPMTAGDTAPVGVLLHDVDVTDGNANGSLLIWGFVNLDRMDTSTKTLITSAVETALSGRVWFLTDN